eukprot:8437396-Prorocentrum_lima.AAC.1
MVGNKLRSLASGWRHEPKETWTAKCNERRSGGRSRARRCCVRTIVATQWIEWWQQLVISGRSS